MKRLIVLVLFLGLILTGCAPSAEAIQQAIAQTQAAAATATPLPTNTPEATPTIEVPPTATLSATEMAVNWDTFNKIVLNLITPVDGVAMIHWVRLDGGVVEIDLQTEWTAQEAQPQVAFDIIKQLSGFCLQTSEDYIKQLTGVSDPKIRINTQSADNLYKYTSTTTFLMCVNIGFGDLNYADWQVESGLTQLK